MPRSVLIVGGGASGTLLAIRLLGDPAGDFDVTLIDPAPAPGRGLAYSATDDNHVLNVVPHRMSAHPYDPAHFWRWLVAAGRLDGTDPFVFVPRRHYGDYLEATLARAASRAPGRLTIVRGAVTALRPVAAGIEADLATGRTLAADVAVLATGHGNYGVPPSDAPDGRPVLILGTGLGMVDQWLTLAARPPGPIVALSRHGLVPAAHRPVPPLALDAADVPFGAAMRDLSRWFRRLAADAPDWRSAVDSLRPYMQRLWHSVTPATRARFLRHARAHWDVRRHRLAPPIAARLDGAIASGALRIVAGTPLGVRPQGGRQTVIYRPRGGTAAESIEVADVVDCRGLPHDWNKAPQNLAGDLVATGIARPDPLRLGLDVTSDCELIAAGGNVHPGLYAIGPLTRGTFFEIEAVPDIRAQCDRLAARLARQLAAVPPLRHAAG